MSEHDIPSTTPAAHHEKPFLFPWNRRLRHLHGISLRNVNTAIGPGRGRGKTITDDDAPYNLDSPTKRSLKQSNATLSHSQSFTNLASAKTQSPTTPKKSSTIYDVEGNLSLRPGAPRLRRRSTLHWSSASPRARQHRLEDLAAHRLADTWFSLHIKTRSRQNPFYISEVMAKSMNPSFAFFDLDNEAPAVSRANELVVRVWARDSTVASYSLLVELDVDLRSLQFIGKQLENFYHPFPQNCILLHLSDGVYTSFTDLPATHLELPLRDPGHTFENTGGSFDVLMQLANLDECIQDAIQTRNESEKEVNQLLEQKESVQSGLSQMQHDESVISATDAAISTLTRQNAALRKKKEELSKSISRRRRAITVATKEIQERTDLSSECVENLDALRAQLRRVEDDTTGQIRRIGEGMLTVFPLEATSNKALQFTIRGIHLPNSSFDDTNRDEIAAALGFTGQLLYQLSLYLAMPLPYPLEINGSYSFVIDPISMSLAQRRYPLHPTNVAYKFEYGVFLLNKDIEFLMSKVNLRVLDIRHTLPNLKYLLYILTAGSGELPMRKVGGVRGLLGSRLTSTMSRRTSEDSVRSQTQFSQKMIMLAQGNGVIESAMTSKEKASIEDPFLDSVNQGKSRLRGHKVRE